MLQVGDVLVSFDVLRECFCCDLSACHGACCVEGDAGAPVTLDEIALIEEALPEVWPDLTAQARAVIRRQGVAYADPEGELVTSIVDGRDCVFALHDDGGHCLCALEKAWRRGRTRFIKPISCHLYPIRVKDFGSCRALNYNRWKVCAAAVALGQKQGLPLYRFLREPLIRRFGEAWYAELETAVRELKAQGLLDRTDL